MPEYLEGTQIVVLERTLFMDAPWMSDSMKHSAMVGWTGFLEIQNEPDWSEPLVIDLVPLTSDQVVFHDTLSVFKMFLYGASNPNQMLTYWGNREAIQRKLKDLGVKDAFLTTQEHPTY
jgi:hypothetical protein